MTRLTLTLAATLATVAPLAAQTTSPTASPLAPTAMYSTWPSTLPARKNIWVVTNSKPGIRQTCRRPEIAADTLSCERRFRKPFLFNRTVVAALLNPAHSENLLPASIFLALGGGTIYGGVLLAGITLAGGIPVIVIGSLLVLVAPLAAAFGDDSYPETLLYQQPDSPLTVTVGHAH